MIASSAVSHAYAGCSACRSLSDWTSTGIRSLSNARRSGPNHVLRGHRTATSRQHRARNFCKPTSRIHFANRSASACARCVSLSDRSMSSPSSNRITCPGRISGRGLRLTNSTWPSVLFKIFTNVSFTKSSCAWSSRNVTENFSCSAARVSTSAS